jgi:two-component system sensor histidine kinase MprB
VSLRARLVLVAAVAVAAAVALASVFVYFLVRNDLRKQVDRNLEAHAERVSRSPFRWILALPTDEPNVWQFKVTGLQFGEEGDYFHLVDSAGDRYEPDIYTPVVLPTTERARAVAAGREQSFFSDLTVEGKHVRVLVRQLQPPLGDEPGLAIEALAPLAATDKELAQIRNWLIVVSFAGVGLASLAGFLVSRTALRPVRELSETAERVRTTRDLSQRIHVDRSDELGRLAATFNAMLESLDDAARRQQRLVQDASHELRTPLTSLRTNIEVLAARDSELPAEEREQLLEDVVEQLGEMTELIGELTVLARGGEQQPAPEELRLDLLTEEAIRRTTRNHPEVPIYAELAPSTVVGTPASLERAIANLLDNAAKWSPAGEPVEVRLVDGQLTVRDHGPGIGADDLPHVFERFYRATSARSMPGSGLGLAIVRQVAESHGGTVVAEQPEDGGTLMRLTLGGRNGADGEGNGATAE